MKFPLVLLLAILAGTAGAQTYRWIDKQGQVHYTDKPPAPGEAAKVEQKRMVQLGADQTVGYALRQAMADHPVTLFTQSGCGEICKIGREHLNKRGVPFTEKAGNSDEDIAALRAVSSDLGVPVLVVGRKVAKGYLAGDWDELLDGAGYPKTGKPAAR
jgi:hypothetical protein